jgi:hypothetical protein
MRLGLRQLAAPTILAVGLGSAIGVAAAQQSPSPSTNPEAGFTVTLSPANEVPAPPSPSDITGTASITINGGTGRVCVNTTTTGSETLTAAHIHRGAAGEGPPAAGQIVVDFAITPGSNSFAKCVDATQAIATEIIGNPSGFYLNVHTATDPAGAARGQLAARGNSAGGLQILPAPVRAYDSRQQTAGPLAADETRTVSLATGVTGDGSSAAAVPTGARAALVTLTITQSVDSGFLTLYSAAVQGVPATSTINWTESGASVATTTTVLVNGDGQVKVTAGPRGTHFIIDVIGYYI